MNILQRTAVFAEWLERMSDLRGRDRIVARLAAAGAGHFGDCAPVGEGVSEMRINFGPGYRVYFMREGAVVYLLLCGGDKSSQKADIARALAMARRMRSQRPERATAPRSEMVRKAKEG